MQSQSAVPALPPVRRSGSEPGAQDEDPLLYDLRFRALLGDSWGRLPPEVRARFSTRLGPGAAITFAGEVVEARRNLFGKLLALLSRPIGAPFLLSDDVGVPVVVTVTEDGASGGQLWTRVYGRARGFPLVIPSSMRFSGPTGLAEHLGSGLGIALRVTADEAGLHFRSDHFFLALGAMRLRLPDWLGPGALALSHVDRPGGRFAVILALHHPLFGETIRQSILFHERLARDAEEPPHV